MVQPSFGICLWFVLKRNVLYQHFHTILTDSDRMGRLGMGTPGLSVPVAWVALVVFALVCNCMKDSVG